MTDGTLVGTAAYTLPLPEGWTDRTAVTLVAPPSGEGFSANVVVTRQALCDNLGLGGFADGHAALIREHATEYAVLATEHGELDGERCLLRTVRWRVGDEPAVQQLQAFCVRDGHGVAVIGSAAAERFAEAEPYFRRTLDGFRFAPAPVAAAR